MAQRYKVNYWLWARNCRHLSSYWVIAARYAAQNLAHVPIRALVEMLREGFIGGAANAFALTFLVVIVSLPFGWILQAVLVVAWNAVVSPKRNSQHPSDTSDRQMEQMIDGIRNPFSLLSRHVINLAVITVITLVCYQLGWLARKTYLPQPGGDRKLLVVWAVYLIALLGLPAGLAFLLRRNDLSRRVAATRLASGRFRGSDIRGAAQACSRCCPLCGPRGYCVPFRCRLFFRFSSRRLGAVRPSDRRLGVSAAGFAFVSIMMLAFE